MSLGSAAQAPKPPPFKAVDIPKAEALFRKYSELGYNLSDTTFLKDFPGLVAARDYEIASINKELTGPLDPTVQNQFATTGATGALKAFGGGQGSIGEEGSAARGSIAASVANQTQTKEDYDRMSAENMIGLYPPRIQDLTGDQALNLMIGNVIGKNQRRQALYQSQVQQYNSDQAAQAQMWATIIGITQQIASTAAKASDARLKENIVWVGESPSHIPICDFNYANDPARRYRGTTGQALQKIRPDAVVKVGDMLYVDYDKIDVKFEDITR